MNNLIETGGNATIIIRAICDFDKYKEGDILSVLHDVYVDFAYRPKEKKARIGDKNAMSYYDKTITGLEINNIPLTSSLLELFQNIDLGEDYIPLITRIENFTYDAAENNNVYYLSSTPDDVSSIRIIPETGYTYYDRSNSIVLENLIDQTEYSIVYSNTLKGPLVNLNKSIDIPYVDIEIQYQGNRNKKATTAVLRFPRVRLKDQPQLNLNQSNVSSYSIKGDVIYDNEDIILMGLDHGE